MTSLYRALLTLSFCYFFTLVSTAQPMAEAGETEDHHTAQEHHHRHDLPALQFIPNQRQWDDRIAFAAELGGLNKLLLEADRFTFVLFDPEQSTSLHDRMQALPDQDVDQGINGHAYSVIFNGTDTPIFTASGTAANRRNYLLGNDPSRWAKDVPQHGKITYNNLYPGVDLDAYSHAGNFKYDFIVRPGGEPSNISFTYDGLDDVRLTDGNLALKTSVGDLQELAPYAYQMQNGQAVKINCHYVLEGKTVSFSFPEGYDASLPLIIDPTVVGATLAGSTIGESFGHSATSDNAGNMYGAGICFGVGYPTTTGAFQQNFRGGQVDIAVSKYSPDGSAQIYATYIGGTNAEYPHSMIVDASGQLSLYGTTFSTNYPTTANAVQSGLRGGTDIVVSKLTADGSGLVGSTYLGGTNDDGRNNSPGNVGGGDQYRGEIVLDGQGNIYLATCTISTDFPVTPNAFQTERGPVGNTGFTQDGVIIKLNSDLSTLFWSTYLGGSGADLASSLRVADDNSVYVSGFAADNDFPMIDDPLLNHPGGNESAYIVRLSSDGSELLNGTFWGTSENDRSYFLDTDELNQVHIFGLSRGNMPVTDGVYSTPGGGRQFVSGFTQDLSQNIYSTVIGSSNGSFGSFEFLPVAFMVDKCNGIYVSGHSSTAGLPLTSDAIYTESNSFYLAKLEPDATALTFGSYYGQANHVDGGTSRFDKGGVVYQGVCSCTDGDRVMNTSSGAWREDQITRCDIGVFKIDFDVDVVTAQGVAAPSTSGCAPLTIDFEYTGRDAQVVSWDFGNGDTGSGENFTYTFTEPGSYTVQQIAASPTSCNPTDTFYLQIDVLSDNSTVTALGFCEGQDITFLDASTPGAVYSWQDGTTSATYQPSEAGTYWVDVSVEGCSRRDSFLLNPLSSLAVDLGEDQRLCDQASLTIDAASDAAVSYSWQDGSGGATFSATTTGNYAVTLTDVNGCFVSDDLNVNFGEAAVIDLGNDRVICEGQTTTLDATASGATYTWQDGSNNPTFTASETGLYRVSAFRDGCPSGDSVLVTVEDAPELEISGMDRICPEAADGSLFVTTTGGGNAFTYAWDTGEIDPERSNLGPGIYVVTVTNENDCSTAASREVVMTDSVRITIGQVDVPCEEENGGAIGLEATSGGTAPYRYAIDGGAYDSIPLFEGLTGGLYTISVRDALDCEVSEEVRIVAPRGIVVEAGQDALIGFGDSIRLNGTANILQGLSFTWSPALDLSCADCPQPFASPLTSRNVFTLTALDSLSGCFYQDSLLIRVDQERNVYVPNAFSPNGDGVNDRFFVNADQSVSQVNYLRVYGRWGQLVYERNNLRPNDPGTGWDGTMNGQRTGDQVFAYVLEVTFLDGMKRVYKGDVTLMR